MNPNFSVYFLCTQICLVDKDSGLFFWFNCKDESSQWADTEGEGWAGYGSRRASTQAPASTFSNTLMDAALGSTNDEEPPRSPRAPTRADEKETEAKHAGEESKPDGIASAGIAAAFADADEVEVAAQSKKARGIAEADAAEPDSDSKTEPITPAVVSAQTSGLQDAKDDDAPAEAKAEDKPDAKEADASAAAAVEVQEDAPAEAKEEPKPEASAEKSEQPAAVAETKDEAKADAVPDEPAAADA